MTGANNHVWTRRPPPKNQAAWQEQIERHCRGAIRWDATHGSVTGPYRGALKSSEKKLALLLATILPAVLIDINPRFDSTVDSFEEPAVWLLSCRGRVRSIQLQWLCGREARRKSPCVRLGSEAPVMLNAPDCGAQLIEQAARLAASWLAEVDAERARA